MELSEASQKKKTGEPTRLPGLKYEKSSGYAVGERLARIIMHMLHMHIIPIIMLLLIVRVMDAVSFHLDYFKL